MRLITAICLLWMLAACATPSHSPQPIYRLVPPGTVQEFFACLKENEITLVSAHRGGPAPGYPENGFETMDAVLQSIPAIMEVDVAKSADGVLFLMHDRTLDRTTTASGPVTETPWDTIRAAFLEDAEGMLTPFRAPTLKDILYWSEGRTIVQLDLKSSVSAAEVVAEVRQVGAENRVVFIAYTHEDAVEIVELLGGALLSVTVETPDDIASLAQKGVGLENILAWTGTQAPDRGLYADLDAQDISVLFGTLGGPNSLDNQFAADGTDGAYRDIAEAGVDVIATDRPLAAQAALYPDGLPDTAMACGIRGPN